MANKANMGNKICMVTGANSGIGKETAKALAGMGAYVIMLCRNEEKAERAKKEIMDQTGHADIEILIADLAHQYDIRKAAEKVHERFDKVDLLINNAGIFPSGRQETPEGIERTFAINYLSHFLLTNLLMDRLSASDHARVINVASDAHKAGAPFFDLDNLMLEDGYNPMKAYGISKLCNIMFTHELAKRTKETPIQTYALHPGMVSTNLSSEASWILKLMYIIGGPFMKSPKSGAQTSIYLAVSDEVEGLSGKYFKNKKETKPASIALDDSLTEQLWHKSEKLTSLA